MNEEQGDQNMSDALRAWAKGVYSLEAGVELLLRACDGRFVQPGYPWALTRRGAGVVYLDASRITDETIGALSGGEQRILRIAASLLGGAPVNLYEDLAGLDRQHTDLVLAAVAHAAGSHEHSAGPAPDPDGRFRVNGVRSSFSRLPSLHPWPEES